MSSKLANGVDYSLSFKPTAATIEDMLSIDLTRMVKPVLSQLEESLKKTIFGTESKIRQATEQLNDKVHLVEEKQQQLAALEQKTNRLKEQYRNEKLNKRLLIYARKKRK